MRQDWQKNTLKTLLAHSIPFSRLVRIREGLVAGGHLTLGKPLHHFHLSTTGKSYMKIYWHRFTAYCLDFYEVLFIAH